MLRKLLFVCGFFTLFANGFAISSSLKIWNGIPVDDINQYPFMVNISELSESPEFECTGTLIAPHWVLTAAHCVTWAGSHPQPSKYKVHANSVYALQGDKYSVEKIFLHPKIQFLPRTDIIAYDVALLKLSTAIKSNYVSLPTVGIPPATSWQPGETVLELGWGMSKPDGPPWYSDQLRQGTGIILSNQQVESTPCDKKDCGQQYFNGNIMVGVGVNRDTIGQGPLPGDSGGPILIKYQDRYFQIGVTSWMFPNTNYPNAASPVIYTRLTIPTIHNWIIATIYPEELTEISPKKIYRST